MICRSVLWMFEYGPECQEIFISEISGVTPTNADDGFNTSFHALDQMLDLTWDCQPLLLTILLNIWTGGCLLYTHWPRMFHKFFIGLRSGLHAEQGMVIIAFRCRKSNTAHVRWGLELSSRNTGLMAKTWLSECAGVRRPLGSAPSSL